MKALIVLTVATCFSFSAMAGDLPQVQAPSELTSGEFAEGTVTRLSSAEVADFLPWAQNARNQLQRALNQSRSLPLRERPAYIERAVKGVVVRSGSRQYQALMRFSLNRGLLLIDELEKNTDMNAVGAQENVVDLLQRAIAVGLSFYQSDLTFQERAQSGNATTVIPYAQFGASFMQSMYPGVVNVLDATAQYRLLYKLVEMVNWDLSRDAEANRYAEAIVEAYEMGQDLPEQPSRDDKSNLRYIRRLNSLRIIGLTVAASSVRNDNEADATPALSTSGTTYGREVDPSRAMVTCTTSSNGYNFSKSIRDRDLAFRTVISDCTSSSSTSNAECQANVSCNDGQSYNQFVRCETSSNGYNFSGNTRSRDLSYRQAVSACTTSSSTSNAECRANVTCNDGQAYPPFVRCETSSNGYSFSANTRSSDLSLSEAVARCRASSSTSNAECAANYICR